MSEVYGRRVVLSAANWFFVVWQIGCARANSIETLIVCRLFAGIGGSGCLTLGAGVIADMFPREQRGMATAVWAMGPLIGPVVGPIAGGFLGQEAGWRWVFWLLLIVGGIVSLGVEFLNKETYAEVLIRWKTEKLVKETGRMDLRSAYDTNKEPVTLGQTMVQSFKRPVLLFVKSPIVFLLCLYMVSPSSVVIDEMRITNISSLVLRLRPSLPLLHYHPQRLHSEIRVLRWPIGTCISRHWLRFYRWPRNYRLHKRPHGHVSYSKERRQVRTRDASPNDDYLRLHPSNQLLLVRLDSRQARILDRAYHWHVPLRSRHDGRVYAYPDIYHRLLSQICSVRQCHFDGDSLPGWSSAPACWAEDVR